MYLGQNQLWTTTPFHSLCNSSAVPIAPSLPLSCSLPISLSLSLPPHTHPLWRQHSRFITCEISRPFEHFLTAPIHTLSLHPHNTQHTHTHTHTHTYSHKHSTHLLTVTIHVSLAVAKLQAPTKFFAANESLLLSPLVLTDTPFCWNTLFLLWLHLFPGFRLGLLFSRPFTFFHGFPCFDLISVCSKAQSLFNFPCVHLRSGTQRGILFEEFL